MRSWENHKSFNLGVREKLDYLDSDLNVRAIILSSIFESREGDIGYEVTDHTAIAMEYGLMEEFDLLVEEAHERGQDHGG